MIAGGAESAEKWFKWRGFKGIESPCGEIIPPHWS